MYVTYLLCESESHLNSLLLHQYSLYLLTELLKDKVTRCMYISLSEFSWKNEKKKTRITSNDSTGLNDKFLCNAMTVGTVFFSELVNSTAPWNPQRNRFFLTFYLVIFSMIVLELDLAPLKRSQNGEVTRSIKSWLNHVPKSEGEGDFPFHSPFLKIRITLLKTSPQQICFHVSLTKIVWPTYS